MLDGEGEELMLVLDGEGEELTLVAGEDEGVGSRTVYL
jgi:hypothetical protein